MRRIALVACLFATGSFAQQKPVALHWVGTWGCAPQLTEPANMPPAPGLSGNTLVQFVRTTIPGMRLRVRFSNLFGNAPLTMNAVHLPGAALTFQGKPSVTIPAGEAIVSDTFAYDLPPASDLAITILFGDTPTALTGHPGSRSTSLLGTAKTVHWYVITGIDVMSDGAEVMVLGDSITDGRGSTPDGNDRWTDDLARRLQADPALKSISVLNEGLGGNAILKGGNGPTALARFDRDIINQNAPRWLIILEGVNDIGVSSSPTLATDLIAAYQTFIDKAHEHKIRVYGVPILPFGRSMYFSPAHEAARVTVNEWIRTSGKFDAVIEMDAAVRDPADPANLLAACDTGDHLHLNPAGYQKMADVIDLSLFR